MLGPKILVLTLTGALGIFVWEVWIGNLGILEVEQEMWIGNLGILEAERGILDKKQRGMAPKLDRLDEKASGRSGKKGSGKRRGGKA